jgi:membrane protease YdiL (CAAX protease family)
MKPNIMPTKPSFLQRHPLLSYFVLAYAITWGGILIFLVSIGFQFAAIQMQEGLIIFGLMILGPSLSGLLLTAALDGRAGLADIWQRMTRWRVGGRWYAIALLTNPVLFAAILLALSVTVSPAYAPGFQVIGLFIGLVAGFFEEIGWTGFATPRLLHKNTPLMAGLILGLLWALWHMLADFSGNINTMGANWPLSFLICWILPLTAYRILMTWVYANTRSVLIAQLMHASYTGWQFAFSPATSFSQNLLWQGLFAAGLWALVALVAVFERRRVTVP